MGCSGSASIYTCAVVEQGACALIKGDFKKSCLVVAWKKWKMRRPDARHACLVKIRVIIVRIFSYFEVIEIVDDNCAYPALLGIDWDFNNSMVVDLKKRRMNF
jgi:hypothetical protein